MGDPETAQIGEADGFALIDFRDTNDCLLASPSEADMANQSADVKVQGEDEPGPCPSFEPKELKPGRKFNPRKSIAWDSAFLDSAGVLDPDELSSIIERADSGEKQKPFLSGIQEELSKSTDSISTFASECLSLESLEADLFCDIRASIQRASKSSKIANSNSKKKPENAETESGASKTVEHPSANSPIPTVASRRQNSTAQGVGKPNKLESLGARVSNAAARSRQSASLLHKPPLAAGKAGLEIAGSTKKLSTVASRIHNGSGAVGQKGKTSSIPKVPRAGNSCRSIPKTTAPAGTPLGPSVTKKAGRPSPRTSCDSSCSSSSETSRASPLDPVRRKADRPVKLISSAATRTSSKVLLKSKAQPGYSRLSAQLKSGPKQSSSISPASSISEWSTESSASTAAVYQKPVDSAMSNPCDSGSDTDTAQTVNKKVLTESTNQSTKPISAGNASLHDSSSTKPSGLRLPSPKIGFFDGAKTGVRTPNGSLQSRSGLLLKSGGHSSPRGRLNKSKLATILPKSAAKNPTSFVNGMSSSLSQGLSQP